MLQKERWDEILEALNANRFRTIMTAFGVFWGIFILVILLALTNGLQKWRSGGFWRLCHEYDFYVDSKHLYALSGLYQRTLF